MDLSQPLNCSNWTRNPYSNSLKSLVNQNLESSNCTIDNLVENMYNSISRFVSVFYWFNTLILEWSKCNFVNSSIRFHYFMFWYWIVSFTMVNRCAFNHKIVSRLVCIRYWAIYSSADCSMECIYSKHSWDSPTSAPSDLPKRRFIPHPLGPSVLGMNQDGAREL